MFDGWLQLILTAGAVFAVAPAKVHRIRRVVAEGTMNTMAYNTLWVGVGSFRRVMEIVEIEYVENKKKVHVKVVVANWAGIHKNSCRDVERCRSGKVQENDVRAGSAGRVLSYVLEDDAASAEALCSVGATLTPLGKRQSNVSGWTTSAL